VPLTALRSSIISATHLAKYILLTPPLDNEGYYITNENAQSPYILFVANFCLRGQPSKHAGKRRISAQSSCHASPGMAGTVPRSMLHGDNSREAPADYLVAVYGLRRYPRCLRGKRIINYTKRNASKDITINASPVQVAGMKHRENDCWCFSNNPVPSKHQFKNQSFNVCTSHH